MADYSISELPVEATDNDTGDLYEVAVPDGEGGFISAKKSHATLTEDLATDAELTAHTQDTDNPHEVTAAQVGAPTTAQLTSHTGDATIHRSIDDDATGSTDLWSAEKITTELAAKAGSDDLATVATTGSYNNLTDKPAIPDALADLDTTVTGSQLTSMKTKLDGVASGATANATDAQLRDRSTHTGTQSADTIVDGATNHVFTAADDAKLAGVASGATANSADATLLNRANHTGTQSASTISDFNASADARISAQKASANGLATLGADSKIPSSQLPSIALTDVHTVSSQTAQLALSAQEGDVAVRTDQNKSYVHNSGTAGTMDDWTLLATPTDAVQSVNGKTGSVTLTTTDVAEGTNLYYPSADKSKLSGVEAGAEKNVNADWDATSGDAQILNKPTLGTAAAADTDDFATAAQGSLADSAIQPGDLADVATSGAYGDLSGTPTIPDALADLDTTVTGSQLNAMKSKLDGVESGAEANDVASVNSKTGSVVLDIDDVAPSQSGNSGKYLQTDGTNASWAAVEAGDSLPDQTGNSGKYLTTDGTDASWGTISTGGLGNVVEDTTPQLGGDLDLNSHKVGDATAADLTKLHGLTATSTELNYVDGVTSAIQTQLDGKAASSHTHTASQITDFDTEVSNNTDVAANTSARHAAVTVSDSSEIDFTLTGQQISAALKSGSIDETKLDTSVNASLDLADSATQPGDLAAVATTGAYADLSGTPDIPDALADLDTTVTGAQLNALKTKVDGIESGATADQTGAEIKAAYEAEDDTNAFTDAEKTKLSGIASGAEVNVQADWDQSTTTADDYIKNKPTLGTAAAADTGDFATAAQGALADSAVQDLSDLSITATASELNVLDGITASTAELNYVDGVTSSVQTQLNGKVPTTRTVNGHALTANVTVDADDVLPTQTSNSGKYLTTNGTTASWATISAGSGDTNYFNDYTANQSGLTSSGLDALTGSVNGSNTTFTVSDEVYVAGTLQVYLNGVLQVLGDAIAETTPSSGIFDFVTAPPTGSQIYVRYATQETASDSVVVASDLADVATSGSYNDLSDTPTIPSDFDDLSDGTTNKAFTATLKTKLDGIESGAEANDVTSVNTQTGVVVLDADDISDSSTTNKFVTAADITKLGNLSGTNTGDQTDITGNAATATKLATARTIAGQSFDGSANISIAPTDLTGVTATASELNTLDGVTATTTELNYVDGVTSAIQTQLNAKVPTSRTVNSKALSSNITLTQDDVGDGSTYKQYSSTEKTKLSGIAANATANDTDANLKNRANHTGTQALSTISDVTASAAEVNVLDGVTATTAELNILDGVTASATELNALDGITASTAELNYTDGVTSNIQTQLNAKVDESTLSASGKGFVNHGSTASTARPSGYASVEWFGSVEPSEAENGDTWIQVE